MISGRVYHQFRFGQILFDFTDASLAQYLAGYLNTEVAALLKAV